MKVNNYYIIKETAKFFDKEITGCIIDEIITQEKNILNLILRNDVEQKILEFSIEKNYEYLILKDSFGKARKNVLSLFPEISGKIIDKVSLYGDDRVVSFKLNDNYEILFSFITNSANCFIVLDNKVIDALKNAKIYTGKHIEELFPRPDTIAEPKTIQDFIFAKYFKYGKEIISYVSRNYDLSLELNAKVQKSVDDRFSNIENELRKPGYSLLKGKQYSVSLLSTKYFQGDIIKEYDNINELITDYIRKNKSFVNVSAIKEQKLKNLNKKIAEKERKIDNLKMQLFNCENSEQLMQFGNIILANLDKIKAGDKLIEIDNLKIKLKEDKTPVENSQIYFEKYKNQKNNISFLKAKIKSTESELKELKDEYEKAKLTEDFKDIKKMDKENKRADEKDETSRLRKFKLNESYEVWVGKDSVSNDLLTMKFSGPEDLWFHVRGASGSHTVLKRANKKESPDKKMVEMAASIAAYYSKARAGRNIPVAYCERKYVKKKKGFKAGSVIMEREKVIFVNPKLPETTP
ncbi:MAG TPA: NFACT RNA binding domain-containing protein [Ignavibacteria bacterium]|nr:NFACT RNA binding domain-containing protein [Ignavibacteria bacterium]